MIGQDEQFLNALADQELDIGATLAFEKRLAEEPALAASFERIMLAKQAVEKLETPVVTADFYDKMTALASPVVVPFPKPASQPRRWWARDGLARDGSARDGLAESWRTIAASLVLTAFLASGGTYMLIAPSADSAVEDTIVGGHQRSLLASNTVDVISSDRHTVRPWFDAKLGISPPTPDLAAMGFPLLGGRVEVVGGKTVPTLVYRYGKHLISIVAIPQPPEKETEESPRAGIVGGYNTMRWAAGGFRYWAVSDLDAAQLAVLVRDFSAK